MARLVLFGMVALQVLGSPAMGRADDAEDKAVAFVEKLGGKCYRDETVKGKPIVAVILARTKATDGDLREFTALKRISTLDLEDTQVTDVGAKELAKLTSITELVLTGTRVTDSGVKEADYAQESGPPGPNWHEDYGCWSEEPEFIQEPNLTHPDGDIRDR